MPLEIALPEVQRHANFHPLSGLITSPRPATIPDLTTEDPFDYTEPRKIGDNDLYLAFYPRARDKEGFIFACLDVPNPVLAMKVGEDREIAGQYRLSWEVAKKWNELEGSLVTVATRLLSGHPQRSQFPVFNLPRMPARYGYMNFHTSKTAAYSAARRSRDAFPFLIALVSFAFSLWLTKWQHNCLELAFQYLLDQGIPGPFLDLLKSSVVCDFTPGMRPGAFLDPYFTLWGPFFHRFTRANVPIWFLWGTDIRRHRQKPLCDPKMSYFYPPDDVVQAALSRSTTQFSAIPLPVPVKQATSSSAVASASTAPDADSVFYDLDDGMTEYDGGTMDCDDGGGPDAVSKGGSGSDEAPVLQPTEVPKLSLAEIEATRAIVNERSKQRPGETHQAMFLRLMKEQDLHLQRESATDRQKRVEKTKSNKRWFTKNSTVYTWEKDDVDPTFWRRRLLRHGERESVFKGAKKWQRHYWTYNDSWDLMFFIEKPPDDYQKPSVWQNDGESDSDDDEPYGFIQKPIAYSELTPIQRLETLAADHIPEVAMSIVREVRQLPSAQQQQCTVPFQPLASYLLIRFGFNVDDPIAFYGQLDQMTDAARQQAFTSAIRVLGYSRAAENLLEMSAAAKLAAASFAGILPNVTLKDVYKGMSSAWDIKSHFVPSIQGLRVQIVSCALESKPDQALYVLRPPRHSSSWFVATRSATVALLVFRKGWASSADIARGLLDLGIRFNTVVERKKTAKADQPSKEISPFEEASSTEDSLPPPIDEDKGEEALGVRKAGFKPDFNDFNVYLATRRELLLGPAGRALRLVGGIVGRVAAEIVTDERVLRGPTLCNNVIGVSGENEYVDDGASRKDLNIVSGLYVVPKERESQKKRSALRSWLPQQGVWEKFCGYFDEQWLPDAENWYTFHIEKINKGEHILRTSSEWKSKLRFAKVGAQRVLTENEDMSAGFIKQHLLF